MVHICLVNNIYVHTDLFCKYFCRKGTNLKIVKDFFALNNRNGNILAALNILSETLPFGFGHLINPKILKVI